MVHHVRTRVDLEHDAIAHGTPRNLQPISEVRLHRLYVIIRIKTKATARGEPLYLGPLYAVVVRCSSK
jgi:hypothetical protein